MVIVMEHPAAPAASATNQRAGRRNLFDRFVSLDPAMNLSGEGLWRSAKSYRHNRTLE
jgi:hypothetical protein